MSAAVLTRHVQDMAQRKGVPLLAVLNTCAQPDFTYPSKNHPGQVRYVKNDLCVVCAPQPDGTLVAITVYAHRVHTPLREDQR